MSKPSLSSRRPGWVVLLAVAGAVLGGALAVQVGRRTRAGRRALPDPAAREVVAPAGPVPAGRPQSLVPMAVGAAIVVVLAVAVAAVTRPSAVDGAAAQHATEPASAGVASPAPRPMSLADCQAAIAAPTNSGPPCGYPPAGMGPPFDEPQADPSDPAYAGAALPVGLTSGGRACATGPNRPTLDTVRPTLATSFAGAPGLPYLEATFQITGVDGPTAHDLNLAGTAGGHGQTAALEFWRMEPLTHGESYRWRVRGTPPTIKAGGWSLWCEFTIAMTTSDDLNLDEDREYTVALPAAKWREMLKVLGPVETYSAQAPIADAVKAAPGAASRVPATLRGSGWRSVVADLTSRASEHDAEAEWNLADLLSTSLDGPSHVTMGFPRT
ncbi:hypothetical protein Adi01nite_68220 [Amorphoplanes digitatis]|nr:hypothetical protein Adi01nite_68220 [Actinoplanes digitatis]